MPTRLQTLHELHRNGHLNAAKKGFIDILQSHPDNVEALHALGMIHAEEENFIEATNYLRSAATQEPHNPIIRLHLANMLKMQGSWDEAADVLETIIHEHTDYAPAYNNLGIINYQKNKLNEAIYFYKIALVKDPHYIDAYYNLGLALVKNNELDASIEIYQQLLTLAPEHAAARFQLASVFMRQEKIAIAVDHFSKLDKSHPQHLETQINLAACYLKIGELGLAKLHYLHVLALDSEDRLALFNLGCICTQQGQVNEAVEYYMRLLAIHEDDFAARHNLGVIFYAHKNKELALHHLQYALELQPQNKTIKHMIDTLKKDQKLLTSPPEYLKSLFDYYADHYEPHLLSTLRYAVPQILYQALLDTKKLNQETVNILDIGCGTGLCGVLLKNHARKLVGVDLSTKMLHLAKQKNIYTDLIEKDFITFLSEQQAGYDLIIAGDALVYLGDLDFVFKYIKQALAPKGLFIFNTEMSDTDYAINDSTRFGHKKAYLEQLAEDNALEVVGYRQAITRYQNDQPVWGHVFVLLTC